MVYFIENIEICYFVFGNKNKKKYKNMLLDNRVFVENNYYKYVVIMLVKIYIIKKIMYGSW